MKVSINDILYAFSEALDWVEAEFLGAKSQHSVRVAALCIAMGKSYGWPEEKLSDLAAAAVLHDNALTEYLYLKKNSGVGSLEKTLVSKPLQVHCALGEKNVRNLPFYPQIRQAIFYHHERADGSGAYGKKEAETPIFAQLIHLGDHLDNRFSFDTWDEEEQKKVFAYVKNKRGKFFSEALADRFFAQFAKRESGTSVFLAPAAFLRKNLSSERVEIPLAVAKELANMFARIVDYKSPFTCRHSQAFAEKAEQIGRCWQENEETCTKFYIAGALHDIGKLIVPNQILEKPDRLTPEEFVVMKTHAWASWKILQSIHGWEDIRDWAIMHHEKLDGTGYPFGKKAEELGREQRLFACLDIYQALVEERPYKKAFTHAAAMNILLELADEEKIDGSMVHEIDHFLGR